MNFNALASLLLPLDPGGRGVVLEANEHWSFDARGVDADVVIWGRAPSASGMPPAAVTRAALAREWTMQQLRRRPPHPWHVFGLHRLPPSNLQRRYGERARAAILGGALVELIAGHPQVRVIDAAAAAAGGVGPVGGLEAGSGGSMLTGLRMRDGSETILRLGMAGGAADPSKGAEALARLASAGISTVPRPIQSGRTGGARWMLESRLPGARVGRLNDAVLGDVARFCARLPADATPSTAANEDLGRIAAAFPHHAALLETIRSFLRPVLRALPAVPRHGDLWSGNLLVDRDRLTGIVDWDAWHPSGVPGTDLLHLLAVDDALRSGCELGSIWLRAPWRSAAYQRLTAAYWPALDVWPDVATLQAVGVAWWAGYIAHSIACDPGLVSDLRWSRLNVDQVLTSLERMVLI